MLECIKPLLHQNLLYNYYNRLCDTRLCYISFLYINFRYIRLRYITFRYINFQVVLYQIPLYQFPIFPVLTDQWAKIFVIPNSIISNSVISISFLPSARYEHAGLHVHFVLPLKRLRKGSKKHIGARKALGTWAIEATEFI